MKWTLAVVGVGLIFAAGCMAKVIVDKRPNLALPVYSSTSTNPVDYAIVDQGYMVSYGKFGFNTDIQSMSAEIATNKTVNFQLGGLHSNVSTNSLIFKVDDLMKIAQMIRELGTNDTLTIDASQFGKLR